MHTYLELQPEMMRILRQAIEHPFWDIKIMDGLHPFPNQDITAGYYTNELTHSGLQHERVIKLMGTMVLMEAMVA